MMDTVKEVTEDRINELRTYIGAVDVLLKRKYNIGGSRKEKFWQDVWDVLGGLKDTSVSTEQVVAYKLEGKNRKATVTDIINQFRQEIVVDETVPNINTD